jgi:hypothetical protein
MNLPSIPDSRKTPHMQETHKAPPACRYDKNHYHHRCSKQIGSFSTTRNHPQQQAPRFVRRDTTRCGTGLRVEIYLDRQDVLNAVIDDPSTPMAMTRSDAISVEREVFGGTGFRF